MYKSSSGRAFNVYINIQVAILGEVRIMILIRDMTQILQEHNIYKFGMSFYMARLKGLRCFLNVPFNSKGSNLE